jgi:hypothetical protein
MVVVIERNGKIAHFEHLFSKQVVISNIGILLSDKGKRQVQTVLANFSWDV